MRPHRRVSLRRSRPNDNARPETCCFSLKQKVFDFDGRRLEIEHGLKDPRTPLSSCEVRRVANFDLQVALAYEDVEQMPREMEPVRCAKRCEVEGRCLPFTTSQRGTRRFEQDRQAARDQAEAGKEEVIRNREGFPEAWIGDSLR